MPQETTADATQPTGITKPIKSINISPEITPVVTPLPALGQITGETRPGQPLAQEELQRNLEERPLAPQAETPDESFQQFMTHQDTVSELTQIGFKQEQLELFSQAVNSSPTVDQAFQALLKGGLRFKDETRKRIRQLLGRTLIRTVLNQEILQKPVPESDQLLQIAEIVDDNGNIVEEPDQGPSSKFGEIKRRLQEAGFYISHKFSQGVTKTKETVGKVSSSKVLLKRISRGKGLLSKHGPDVIVKYIDKLGRQDFQGLPVGERIITIAKDPIGAAVLTDLLASIQIDHMTDLGGKISKAVKILPLLAKLLPIPGLKIILPAQQVLNHLSQQGKQAQESRLTSFKNSQGKTSPYTPDSLAFVTLEACGIINPSQDKIQRDLNYTRFLALREPIINEITPIIFRSLLLSAQDVVQDERI